MWRTNRGEGALLATAIHNGHDLRAEVAECMVLPEKERLYEEDPYTGRFTTISASRIVLNRSRFEMDLNRPRDKAIYRTPDYCWGLNVWKSGAIPDAVAEESLKQYDQFYEELKEILSDMQTKYGAFVVYDIHSYNHRRDGADSLPEDPEKNPEINVGTGTMDRERWGGVVDAFMDSMKGFDYSGRKLDVRENVKFRGGWMSQWIHNEFPKTGCCLAIEFKKFFMDEWTGEPFDERVELLRNALRGSVEPVLKSLQEVSVSA